MSHSARLSRRMARARISACYQGRASDTHFPRIQPAELRRLEFDHGPLLPLVINWHVVRLGAGFALALVAVVFASVAAIIWASP